GWLSDTQSTAGSPCPTITDYLNGTLISPRVWYGFNLTIHGLTATGSLNVRGAPPCTVTGTFPSSSPAAAGTGFGLYAGGYSVLFDNVTVETVNPSITQTGFSDSFYQNGVPSHIVHDAPAG